MDMVERLARAIDPQAFVAWDKHRRDTNARRLAIIRAKCVLAALREPTEAMMDAGGRIEAGAVDNGAQDEIGSWNAGNVWRAMIDAAEGR